MPVTDFDCANVVAATYWAPDTLTRTLDISGVFVGIQETPDATIVCCRGSTTFLDWMRDFEDGAQMVTDPDLGNVHPGFLEGMRDLYAGLMVEPMKPIVYTGHSLGAARTWILAALAKIAGHQLPADRIVVFGSPLPGAQRLSTILASYPKQAYKNRFDPVADVPFDIPFIDPYVRPCDNARLNVRPPMPDPWGIFADHHFQLYWDGLAAEDTPFPAWMPKL